MSLASIASSLASVRDRIRAALTSKGLSVSSSITLNQAADLLDSLPSSGGVDVAGTTATPADVLEGKAFVDSGGNMTSGTIQTVSPVSSGSTVSISSGFLASSVSIIVSSGGIDVSDTTATAADVLNGKVFRNSAGILTSGTIPTLSAASTYMPGTTAIHISGGQYIDPATGITIAGDDDLVASNIISGVSIFGVAGTLTPGGSSGGADVTLGYITSDGKFQALTFSGTSAANSGEPVTLSAYTWNLPGSSGGSSGSSSPVVSSGIVIISGGSVISSSNIDISGYTVSSGYSMCVWSGKSAVSCIVETGGHMRCSSAGVAKDCTVNGGAITIYGSRSLASNCIINGGQIHLNSYGSGSCITVNSGAMLAITASNAYCDTLTISSGGTLFLLSASLPTNLTSMTGAIIMNYSEE